MSVHNHPPYEPNCSERWVGRCMVTIDPEDREQVERFAVAYTEVAIRRTGRGTAWAQRDADSRDKVIADLQAALREFANPTPPPIDEPTNLYAVVRDRTGNEWCLVGEGVWRSLSSTGAYVVEKHWHDNITPLAGNAVALLSEGVTS